MKKSGKKLGRPPLQPKSGAVLREEAQARIREAKERRLGRADLDVEEFVDKVGTITGKHKFTRQEMDSIRETVDLLYTEFVTEKQEREAIDHASYAKAAQTAVLMTEQPSSQKPMSKEEWNKEHGLRKNGKGLKPGPPKKKKRTVWDLAPGEMTTASKPGEQEDIDIDKLEQEYMEQQFAEHIEAQKKRHPSTIGKRFRTGAQQANRVNPPKNFWI